MRKESSKNKVNPKALKIHQPSIVIANMKRVGKSNSMPNIEVKDENEAKIVNMGKVSNLISRSRVLGVYNNRNITQTMKSNIFKKISHKIKRFSSKTRRIANRNKVGNVKMKMEIYKQKSNSEMSK